MPDLDLEAIKREWLVQCGPCDFGLAEMSCNCPTGDYRPPMSQLVAEVENLRADRAQWAWKAGAARGTAHEIVALLPAGKLRDQAAEKVADLDRALFPSAAAGEQREADGA